MPNILITTAHPDYELIWFGSTLYELAKIKDINIFNICFWDAIRIDQSGNFRAIGGCGWYDVGSSDTNGFRMQPTSGDFASYSYSVYGLLK